MRSKQNKQKAKKVYISWVKIQRRARCCCWFSIYRVSCCCYCCSSLILYATPQSVPLMQFCILCCCCCSYVASCCCQLLLDFAEMLLVVLEVRVLLLFVVTVEISLFQTTFIFTWEYVSWHIGFIYFLLFLANFLCFRKTNTARRFYFCDLIFSMFNACMLKMFVVVFVTFISLFCSRLKNINKLMEKNLLEKLLKNIAKSLEFSWKNIKRLKTNYMISVLYIMSKFGLKYTLWLVQTIA